MIIFVGKEGDYRAVLNILDVVVMDEGFDFRVILERRGYSYSFCFFFLL